MAIIVGGHTLFHAERRVYDQVLTACRAARGAWVPVAECCRPVGHSRKADENAVARLLSLRILQSQGVEAEGERAGLRLRLKGEAQP